MAPLALIASSRLEEELDFLARGFRVDDTVCRLANSL
jgi:hypothetical protein